MLSRCVVFLLICSFSLNSLAITELIFLKGSVKHNPELGVPPLTKSELLQKAHKRQLNLTKVKTSYNRSLLGLVIFFVFQFMLGQIYAIRPM